MTYRPDLSDYVAHFTAGRPPLVKRKLEEGAPLCDGMSAYDRLLSILRTQTIVASPLPWNNRKAVCLTECPWASMIAHAKRYSSYAVAFAKPRVFAAGGGPAYYVRSDHWKKQDWESHLQTFVTPFWPSYRPNELRGNEHLYGKTVDFSHEREWRVPHDFTFELNQVEFVVLKSTADLERFPGEIRNAIGREKFLVMDVYKTIEKLWPVHNLGGASN